MEYIVKILFSLSLLSVVKGSTVGGNSEGDPCVFPFIFQSTSYTHCIDLDHDKPWCSTTANFDENKHWGECQAEDLKNLPSFDPGTPTNVTLYQRDTARLMCTVRNLQGKKVSWQRKGQQYPLTITKFTFIADGRYSVESDEDSEWNLIIKKLRISDSGIYECRVTTQTRQLVREIHLTVQDRLPQSTPAVSLGDQAKLYIEKGKPLMLQCNATAKSEPRPGEKVVPPEVEWFKDGHIINSQDQRGNSPAIITNQVRGYVRISTLEIEKTGMNSAGSYICRTTDKANAEVQVSILNLNVGKDNVKRGTASDTDALQGGNNSNNAVRTITSYCLLSLITMSITRLYLT